MYRFLTYFVIVHFSLGAYAQSLGSGLVNPSGKTVSSRVELPEDFVRPPFPSSSIQHFLQSLPIRNGDEKVKRYDGYEKKFICYVAVIDSDVKIEKDLIHGEHVIQRLRANYLFDQGKYEHIRFSVDNNRNLSFEEYAAGTRWVWQDSIYVKDSVAESQVSKESLQAYLNYIHENSTANALLNDTRVLPFGDISVGDLFIQAQNERNKGHAVLVVDMAVNPLTGERIVLLAQGFNPTEDMHLLKNTIEPDISPWYRINEDDHFFTTAQWTFRKKHCRRFKINANTWNAISAE